MGRSCRVGAQTIVTGSTTPPAPQEHQGAHSASAPNRKALAPTGGADVRAVGAGTPVTANDEASTKNRHPSTTARADTTTQNPRGTGPNSVAARQTARQGQSRGNLAPTGHTGDRSKAPDFPGLHPVPPTGRYTHEAAKGTAINSNQTLQCPWPKLAQPGGHKLTPCSPLSVAQVSLYVGVRTGKRNLSRRRSRAFSPPSAQKPGPGPGLPGAGEGQPGVRGIAHIAHSSRSADFAQDQKLASAQDRGKPNAYSRRCRSPMKRWGTAAPVIGAGLF